jgi:hypothetical protein
MNIRLERYLTKCRKWIHNQTKDNYHSFKFDFSLNCQINFSEFQRFDMTLQPSVNFHLQKLYLNINEPGLVIIQTIQAANMAVTVGNASDALQLS